MPEREKSAEGLKGWQLEVCRPPSGCHNRALADESFHEAVAERLERRHLAAVLPALVGGRLRHRHEFRVAVSFCPNACSRPQIADVGFIGAAPPRLTAEVCHQCMGCVHACREGAVSHPGLLPILDPVRCLSCGACSAVCLSGTIQVARQGWRVVAGGMLGRHPRLAVPLPGLHTRESALAALDCCLDHYLRNARGEERFGALLARAGMDRLEECVRVHAEEPPPAPPRRLAPILRGPV